MDDLQYLSDISVEKAREILVLNLVINGWPSIQDYQTCHSQGKSYSFKPCYKWMTFNTVKSLSLMLKQELLKVLNLVINGWPSIQR